MGNSQVVVVVDVVSQVVVDWEFESVLQRSLKVALVGRASWGQSHVELILRKCQLLLARWSESLFILKFSCYNFPGATLTVLLLAV